MMLFPNKDYLTDYQSTHLNVDMALLRANSFWSFPFDIETFLQEVANSVELNDYKYRTLAGTIGLEYDPISNYDMTEEGTDITEGNDDNVYSTGNQTVTSSAQYGKDVNAEVKQVSPMDRTDFVNSEQTTDTRDARNDSQNQTISSREDTHHLDTNRTIKHELKRKGNIGITSSQQLIESERQVALFNLYNIMWQDVVNAFLYLPNMKGMFEYENNFLQDE